MKNTGYIFEDRASTINDVEYTTRDYFSYFYDKIQTIIKDNFDFFEYLQINDDLKMDVLAYNRYGNEDYADILVLVNQANFLWMSPYNTDIQISTAEAYSNYIDISLNSTKDESKEEFISEYGKEVARINNEERRNIIVPKVRNMQDVINLLKDYRSQNSDIIDV